MNRDTGRALDRTVHLRQSIADILTTPIGSRVMRRDYGSQLPELIDQPYNGATRLRCYAAIVIALTRWEPRLRLTRVQLTQGDTPGSTIVDLEGAEADDNAGLSLRVPLQLGGVA
jgi:phage baseplate assembly protein W